MEVILQQDYPQLGFIGDRLSVKRGYARNFLLPRGIALEVSSRNAKELKHRLALISARKEKKKAEAQELADKLNAVVLEFKLKIGVSGKSYGSIQSKEIDAELKKLGFVLERRQIRLGEPIKTAGEFKVTIKLHSEVSAACAVNVKADKIVEAAAPEDTDRKKGGRRRKSEGAAEGESPASGDLAQEAAPEGEKRPRRSKAGDGEDSVQ